MIPPFYKFYIKKRALSTAERDKKGIAARIYLRGYALMLTKGRHICRIYRNLIQKSYVGDVAAVAAFSEKPPLLQKQSSTAAPLQ